LKDSVDVKLCTYCDRHGVPVVKMEYTKFIILEMRFYFGGFHEQFEIANESGEMIEYEILSGIEYIRYENAPSHYVASFVDDVSQRIVK
jgi:hypothetical protein